MKKFNAFKKLHFLVIIMYVVMYLTGVFQLDYKWNSPIKHPVLGLLLIGSMTLYLIDSKNRSLIKRMVTFNFNIRKGKIYHKIFKISVILLTSHFLIAIITGLLMFSRLITDADIYNYIYIIHSSSRYTVLILILFHLMALLLKKMELKRRKR